jgi:hypothetical protein
VPAYVDGKVDGTSATTNVAHATTTAVATDRTQALIRDMRGLRFEREFRFLFGARRPPA